MVLWFSGKSVINDAHEHLNKLKVIFNNSKKLARKIILQ